MTGGVMSRTVTVNWQELGLADASMVLQVTVVVPRVNRLPLGGTQVTGKSRSQLSVALGAAKVTTVPFGPAHSTVKFAGQAPSTGGVELRTVTETLQVSALPASSVTVTMIECEPIPSNVPGWASGKTSCCGTLRRPSAP